MAGTTQNSLELPIDIGRYRIVRLIGEGAMGRVLLAHDPVLDREVAIKVLRDDLKIAEDVRQGLIVRMRHEARAAARVAHPNLVTLHDMGEDDEIGLFLVFEYIPGPTLKQLIAEGPLAPKRAARMARELGSALTFAHEAGVLHRDIKPDNVILCPTGAKLADFGIARVPDSTLTHAGGLLGTPAYSAPETFKHSKFSPESDQFSLASTLYEAVSGRRAFPGDDAVAVAAKIAHDDILPMAHVHGLPAEVDVVFRKAMSKAPEERYETCERFGLALVGALTGLRAGATDQAPRTSKGAPPLPPLSSASGAPASSKLAFSAPSSASPDDEPDHPTLALPSVAPPPRRTGQVVLGALVVVATAAALFVFSSRGSRTELTSATSEAETSAKPSADPSAPVPLTVQTGAQPPTALPSAAGGAKAADNDVDTGGAGDGASADPAAGGGGPAAGGSGPAGAGGSPRGTDFDALEDPPDGSGDDLPDP